MSIRPDFVDCWVFRGAPPVREVLLLRRAPDEEIFPGLWQCVSGSLEPGERVAVGALREVAEETGLAGDAILHFYDLDLVNQFHEPWYDAIVTAVVFAVQVRADAAVVLSDEHDACRWLPLSTVADELVWPGYHDAVTRIDWFLADPARASWFELTTEGLRVPR